MIVYAVMPIDFWSGWQRPEELFRGGPDLTDDCHPAADWPPLWEEAKKLATRAGWEGDVSQGPFVTVVPEVPGTYSTPPVIIAWKQKNNGTSFVASPFPLPWLEGK